MPFNLVDIDTNTTLVLPNETKLPVNISETLQNIVKWAHDRNLIEGATRHAQMLKLTEEFGELAGGIAKNRPEVVKDSIGDMVVVLTILAEQSGLTLSECAEYSYNQIKDRKGKMVNGIFVKEEDL